MKRLGTYELIEYNIQIVLLLVYSFNTCNNNATLQA